MSETVLSFIPMATEILDELYTSEITLTQATHTRANPWEKAASISTDTQTVKAAVFPSVENTLNHSGVARLSGGLVEKNELYIIIAAEDLDFIPDTETTVTVGSKSFPIDRVNGWPEIANVAVYEIFCRLSGQ